MEEETGHNYLNLLSLKVLDLKESEIFYQVLFDHIGLVKKEVSEDFLSFWGPFGVMLREIKETKFMQEPEYRIGLDRVSVRVSSRLKVDDIFKSMSDSQFDISWEPKHFDYSPGYYSVGLFDPDENLIEVVYMD